MGTKPGWLRELVPARARQQIGYGWNRLRAPFLAEPYRSVVPYTMVGLPRLRNLHALAKAIDEEKIPGDIVECGTCNGGTGALLAQVAAGSRFERHVWLLDSFAGLPAATAADGPHAAAYTGACRGDEATVRRVLDRTGVLAADVTLVKGWFSETLPGLSVERIALLHIDADWYESVLDVLRHLYDRVSDHGYIVLDDYGYWEGCRRAVTEFLADRGTEIALTDVDGIGAFFRKPAGR